MNRIMPEMVKEAYGKTGIIPIVADWADWKRNNKCGCALTACYYAKAENPMDFDDYVGQSDEFYEAILSDVLGLEEVYIRGSNVGLILFRRMGVVMI